MTKLQWIIYAVFLGLNILGIATAIEFYKKGIRKDMAKVWEIRLVALVLTVLDIAFLPLLNIFQPLLGLLGAPEWADFLLYTAVFYWVQRYLDMKVVKKVFKNIIRARLRKLGLTDEQIDDILNVHKSQEN